MNKNQTRGSIDKIKGKVKEVAGKLTGDKELEQKGRVQNLGGEIQAGLGDLQEAVTKPAGKH